MVWFCSYRHRGDRRFGEQTLRLLELAVALVRLRVGAFVSSQIAVPSAYDVTVQLCVLQVGSLKGIYLALQVGQRFL